MKLIIIYPISIIIHLTCLCQNSTDEGDFGESKNCNINVNDNHWWQPATDNIKGATFKFRIGGNCTGTLLNQYTNDGGIKQYFITANHCLKNVNLSGTFDFIFHYQSPTGNNDDTKPANQGHVHNQSATLNDNKYYFYHQSQINIIKNQVWGDFAILEILTPIPPHFNVSYAGWYPFSDGYSLGSVAGIFYCIHHPRGDIKKASMANMVLNQTNTIATSCQIVTTIINTVLGWFGITVNTSIVCNYVDIPWYVVPAWSAGTTETGSSGSPLYNWETKIIGSESGSFYSACPGVNNDTYSKFWQMYNFNPVRDALNPSGDAWINIAGVNERKIDTWSVLNNLHGYYFPASHYQSESNVTLKSESTISTSTSDSLIIFNEADYTFTAASEITLNPGFTVENGAVFEASIDPSVKQDNNPQLSPQQQFFNAIGSIKLPERLIFEKDFDNAQISKNLMDEVIFKIAPNPCTKDNPCNIIVNFPRMQKEITLQILNNSGQVLQTLTYNNAIEINYNINSEIITQSGFVICKVNSENWQGHKKIMIIK